jgi:predicted transcriptional regulator
MAIKIELKRIRTPPAGSIENDIDFICRSFGYFTKRDKNNTAGRIFHFIIKKNAETSEGVTSDEIANALNLTRGAIVYHLNNFISAGLIVREKNQYRLRSHCLQKSIDDIKNDAQRIFNEMMKIAREIDEELGIFYR